MKHLTTITRTGRGTLPDDLAILQSAVFAARPLPQPSERVGYVEGVVTHDRCQLVFFIVRLEHDNEATARRILVPVAALDPSAIRARYDASLVLSWTVDQVLAQPDFVSDAMPPRNHEDGGRVRTGRWLPAVPNAVPPGKGLNHGAAWRQRLAWGALSAMIGLGAALLAGAGFTVALSAALFFGLGGAIAGSIYGYSRDSATDASEFKVMDPSPEVAAMMGGVERALRQTDAFETGALQATLIRGRLRSADHDDTGKRAPPAMGALVRHG
jgi:hypothetical protein